MNIYLNSISIISTIAGTGTASYNGDNVQATSASISGPAGIAIDTSGNIYFSDSVNNRVRMITELTGIISTYAGTGAATYSGDNFDATNAALYSPNGLCIDSSGIYYFSYSRHIIFDNFYFLSFVTRQFIHW